jgi:hypothetical protein
LGWVQNLSSDLSKLENAILGELRVVKKSIKGWEILKAPPLP